MDAHAGQRLRVRLADGRSISGIGAASPPTARCASLPAAASSAVRSGRIVSARLA